MPENTVDNVQTSPGSLSMKGVSLRRCIKWAYDVQNGQISGADLNDRDQYDIAARSSGPVTEAQMKTMAQAMLEDRFGLVLHRQTREASVYVLSVSKAGPKFHESEGEGKPSLRLGSLNASAQWTRIADFATLLSGPLQTPVVDMTGLGGRYTFSFDLAPYVEAAATAAVRPDPASILITALQEQLGLRIEPKKAPVEMLIVDHVGSVSPN